MSPVYTTGTPAPHGFRSKTRATRGYISAPRGGRGENTDRSEQQLLPGISGAMVQMLRSCLIVFLMLCVQMPSAVAQVIQPLGGFTARAVSADGSTVVGTLSTMGSSYAVRWTLSGGMQLLADPARSAAACNADGTVVVGGASMSAFRWISNGMGGGILEDLDPLMSGTTTAAGVSANGMVVVGTIFIGAVIRHVFRWEGGVLQDRGDSGGCFSGNSGSAIAAGGSADGEVVVGRSTFVVTTMPCTFESHAFRLTAEGFDNLGVLPGNTISEAEAVSGDGRVVVGFCNGGTEPVRAFRWESGVMENLGLISMSTSAHALAVNGDGSVVVGRAQGPSPFGDRSFLWTRGTGIVDLETYFLMRGVDLTGWSLGTATGISADGTTIAGNGSRNGTVSAWRVTLPCVFGPHLVMQPMAATTCPTGTATFSVTATGTGLSYQWQIEDPPSSNTWFTLGNDPGPLPGGGSAFAFPINSPSVSIGVRNRLGVFNIRSVVTNACGSVNSDTATLTITDCAADFNCDGFVNSQDFFDFLAAFFMLQPAADFNHDTFINSQDFFDFLAAFFTGC